MDYNAQETNIRDKRQHQQEQAYQDFLIEDLVEDFRLPINHKPTENVDLDNVEQATLDTRMNSSNVGFRLLQKMGWKGKGLGKDEQGLSCGNSLSGKSKGKAAYNKRSSPNPRKVGSLVHRDCPFIMGIIEPIRSGIRDPKLGIGKQEEDDFFTAEENIQPRKLDI
ncbi:hypothetical protein CRYUN_Cryun05aG0001400 [Craigia yunnanensis]